MSEGYIQKEPVSKFFKKFGLITMCIIGKAKTTPRKDSIIPANIKNQGLGFSN